MSPAGALLGIDQIGPPDLPIGEVAALGELAAELARQTIVDDDIRELFAGRGKPLRQVERLLDGGGVMAGAAEPRDRSLKRRGSGT